MSPELPEETKSRVDEARARLKDAEALMRADFPEAAAHAAYYAAYHAALGLLALEDSRPRTHRGVASEFGRLFVQTGRIHAETGALLERTLDVRLKADYGVLTPVSEEEAEDVVQDAQAFLEAVVATLEEQERQ